MDRVWRIVDPSLTQMTGTSFARYVPGEREFDHCEECSTPFARRAGAPVVSIDRGEPAALGDWTWSPVTSDPLVSEALAAALRGRFQGFELSAVEAVDSWTSRDTGRPGAGLPARLFSALSSAVELRVVGRVPLLWDRSSVVWRDFEGPPPVCGTCGTCVVIWGRGPTPIRPRMVVISGAEATHARIDEVSRDAIRAAEVHQLPIPGSGAIFRRADVGALNVWRIDFDQRAILCDDEFKAAVELAGPMNAEFLLAGAII